MIKKVEGPGSIKPTQTKEVDQVRTNEVGGVNNVTAVNRATGAERAKRLTRPMTSDERAQLLSMVDEEAEKLLKNGIISRERKETLTQAVKMTISAGATEEEEA
jgi:hypothetical protein